MAPPIFVLQHVAIIGSQGDKKYSYSVYIKVFAHAVALLYAVPVDSSIESVCMNYL